MRDVGAPDRARASWATARTTSPRSSRARSQQQRLLAVAPREPSREDLAAILRASL